VLPTAVQEYKARLDAQISQTDSAARRHHYVPKTYLRAWSKDGKRVQVFDTVTGATANLGIRDICFAKDFHRVVGPSGEAHNKVELLFGVVDAEMRRVLNLVEHLADPESLTFDDFVALCVVLSVQRMRTSQQRRLTAQSDAWLAAQESREMLSPRDLAAIHTRTLFHAMWSASDIMTTRQLEIWRDPRGRFVTSDCPVQIPFVNRRRPGTVEASRIWWPISPRTTISLSNDLVGEKAVIRPANARVIRDVREMMMRGRERHVIIPANRTFAAPAGGQLRSRVQLQLRCSQEHEGRRYEPPECVVGQFEWLGSAPDVSLCNNGLHRSAPEMHNYV
jgi:hypothetical protein